MMGWMSGGGMVETKTPARGGGLSQGQFTDLCCFLHRS